MLHQLPESSNSAMNVQPVPCFSHQELTSALLAGGGMTVALSDTMLLCDMLRPLPDFSDSVATAQTTHAFYTKRKPLSATINTLANALYQVTTLSWLWLCVHSFPDFF